MKEKMESLGDSISLASVGRLLKELDGLGWTELVSSQGRILTAKGQRQLEALQIDVERLKIEAEMKEATDPENAQDIIDLLNVRVIIESEVIKSVIENASDEEIGRLEDSVKRHKQCVSMGEDTELLPINFHQVLCTLSCNRFLNSVLKLLIHEELRLEEKFPEIATKLRDAHHLVEHELNRPKRLAWFTDVICNCSCIDSPSHLARFILALFIVTILPASEPVDVNVHFSSLTVTFCPPKS